MTSAMQPSRARPAGRTAEGEPGARGFAWGVWGFMTLLAVGFVARYGTTIPVWDDEDVVPVMLGAAPVTPAWLWEQCNEHRIPLPKLILVVADRWAGRDIRAGMFLSVAALAAAAAGLLAALGRLRGGPRATDALVPILLLHPGHATNLLWSIQFAFVLPTALALGLLAAIAGRPGRLGVRAAWGAGLVLACLPLCGGTGLVFVPALACWLAGSAWAEARAGGAGARGRGGGIALAAMPAIALTAAYFRGFRAGVRPESPGGVPDAFRAALQFLAGGGGVTAEWSWPWSGVATAGGLAAAVAAVLLACRHPEERARAGGLLAILGGVVTMSLAVGWGRGWAGARAGFQDRYTTMAAPFWCWLLVAIRLYAPGGRGRALAALLFGLGCCLAWPNAESGLRRGREGVAHAAALARDIRDGMPPYRIARAHVPYLYPDADRLMPLLATYRAGKLGPFAGLQTDPPFREVALPVDPVRTTLVRWEAPTARVVGVDPQVEFALPRAMHVAGIRIRYAHANTQKAPARFVATWRCADDRGDADDRRAANWNLPTGTGRETTIWVDARIDRFRIQPDNLPGEFRFDSITLLLPPGGP